MIQVRPPGLWLFAAAGDYAGGVVSGAQVGTGGRTVTQGEGSPHTGSSAESAFWNFDLCR